MNASKMQVVLVDWPKGPNVRPTAPEREAVQHAVHDALCDLGDAEMTTEEAEDAILDTIKNHWKRYFVGWEKYDVDRVLAHVLITLKAD